MVEDEDERIQVRTQRGETFSAEVLRQGSEDDPVAILSVDTRQRPLQFSTSDEGEPGDQVFVLANPPRSPSFLAQRAVVTGATGSGELIFGDIRLEGGYGGSPVIGRSGSVVGMFVISHDVAQVAGGRAISADALKRALAEVHAT